MAIPQRGLGFANPAAKRAQMLAALNGSTAVPFAGMPGPMGPVDPPMGPVAQAPAPAQVAQLPMPNIPVVGPGGRPSPADVQQLPNEALMQGGPNDSGAAPPPETEEPEGGTPKWARIAGALGHIILSADAGYRGQPMPKYVDPAKAEQDEAMQQAEFLINTTARAWEVARKAPPGQREDMLGGFEKAIKRVAPDFDFRGMIDSLEDDGDKIDAVAPQIAMMSPEAKQMFMSAMGANGGDARAAAALLKDEKFMKTLTDFEDTRNAAPVRYKMAAIKQGMDKLGLSEQDLADLTPENFEALNAQLPEKAQLSPSEIATLRRNPRLGAAIGMRTPEMEPEQTLDSRAGIDRRTQPAPGAATSPTTSTRRPAPTSPSAAPPKRPPARGRPQAEQRAPARDAAPPQEPQRAAPPPKRTSGGPLSAIVDLSRQKADELKAAGYDLKEVAEYLEGKKRGEDLPVPQPRRQASAPAAKPGKPEPGPRQAAPKRAAPEQQQAVPKRFTAPRDMVIPGVGNVKKGDVVMYDEASGKYSRGAR